MFAGNFGCYSDWHEVPLQSLNLWPLGCKPRSTTIRPQLGSTRITLCIYRMEQPVWLNRVLQLWKTLKPCVRVLACHQWRPLRFRTSDTFSPLCGFVPTARDGAVWWNLQDGVRPGETPPRVKRETEQRTGGHRIVSTALEQNKKKKQASHLWFWLCSHCRLGASQFWGFSPNVTQISSTCDLHVTGIRLVMLRDLMPILLTHNYLLNIETHIYCL